MDRPKVTDYGDIQKYAQDLEIYCDYLELKLKEFTMDRKGND